MHIERRGLLGVRLASSTRKTSSGVPFAESIYACDIYLTITVKQKWILYTVICLKQNAYQAVRDVMTRY